MKKKSVESGKKLPVGVGPVIGQNAGSGFVRRSRRFVRPQAALG
jgi:hypothetical protein